MPSDSLNQQYLDVAVLAYCKATGLNPDHHAATIQEPMRQAIEAYRWCQSEISYDKALDRALEMLRVAAHHCEQYASDCESTYDGTECDGSCIADDCRFAADEFKHQYTRATEPVSGESGAEKGTVAQEIGVSLEEIQRITVKAWKDRHPDTEQPDECREAFDKWFEALLLMNRGKITLLSKDFAWGVWEPAWNAKAPKRELLSPDMPIQELCLHMGELTAEEVRVARAAIAWANTHIEDEITREGKSVSSSATGCKLVSSESAGASPALPTNQSMDEKSDE